MDPLGAQHTFSSGASNALRADHSANKVKTKVLCYFLRQHGYVSRPHGLQPSAARPDGLLQAEFSHVRHSENDHFRGCAANVAARAPFCWAAMRHGTRSAWHPSASRLQEHAAQHSTLQPYWIHTLKKAVSLQRRILKVV